MSEKLNALVRCVHGVEGSLTPGEYYAFINGKILYNDGVTSSEYNTVEEFNKLNPLVKLELVTMEMDKSKLKSGYKVVDDCGREYIVLKETETLHNSDGEKLIDLSIYNNDLTTKGPNFESFNIQEVYDGNRLIMNERVRRIKTAQEAKMKEDPKEMRDSAERKVFFQRLSSLLNLSWNKDKDESEEFQLRTAPGVFKLSINGLMQKGDYKADIYAILNQKYMLLEPWDIVRGEYSPRDMEDYYYPDIIAGACHNVWSGEKTDKKIKKNLGVYRTKKEAMDKAKELWPE